MALQISLVTVLAKKQLSTMISRFLVFIVLTNHVFDVAISDDPANYFLIPTKSVPRIGKRAEKGSPQFEDFFIKASKSVPRIGRRNENPNENHERAAQSENGLIKFKYPTWSEIAERYEYEPELFSSPQLLRKLEEEYGDDPNVYEWDKVRLKRNVRSQNRHSLH